MRPTIAIRICGVALLFACALTFRPAFSGALPRQITLDDRVKAQRAIEEVYWRHRIWPAENTAAKPPLADVMPDAAIRESVEDFLRRSSVMASYVQKPVDGRALQAEIDRIVRETQAPETLRELFEALHDDPFLIAECLARPLVTQRLLDLKFAGDANALDAQLQAAKSLPLDASALAAPPQGYTVSAVTTTGCTNDAWTAIAPAVFKRYFHSAVWTGAEMIVWGGRDIGIFNSGERYNPATNSWTPTAGGSGLVARFDHTAIWTGSAMIVWGGLGAIGGTVVKFDDGARYNPSANTWTPLSTTNAPVARNAHTAVWTGSKMIVWGGATNIDSADPYLNTGGIYDPAANSWSATSTGDNVPSKRWYHTAVWTGSEMIVWGGDAAGGAAFDTGGRYNPNTNSWQATSQINAPLHRVDHSAVWTGSEMIVWGGVDPLNGSNYLASGSVYDPAANAWTATSIPLNNGHSSHSALWTGAEMIVWGGDTGQGGGSNTGLRYVRATNSWSPTSTASAPSARSGHTAVWTGLADRRMIVFGGKGGNGSTNTGASYCVGECTSASATCDDRNSCTTDACQNGACVSTPIVCASANPCASPAYCDVQTGQCATGDPIPDGISCNDGNPCTGACPTCGLDICLGGVCGCDHPPGACKGSLYAFDSTDVPKSIPSTGTPLVTSTINVSGAGVFLTDLDLKTFIRHTNASNLDITLTSPAGTVVTVTTDNGGTNDNVFNGTLWDDQADPGNHSGGFLVTTASYADKTVETKLVPEEAFGAFIGENPNGVWTLRISDDQDLDGGSLDHWSMYLTSLTAAPPSATSTFNAGGLPLAIPAPAPARDTRVSIAVSGLGTEIGKIKATTGISHTNNADLTITLVSPSGNTVTLSDGNGGSNDNVFSSTLWDDRANLGGQVPYTSNSGLVTDRAYANNVNATTLVPQEALAAFKGENPNGTWTLIVVDSNSFSGSGSLNTFSLQITTFGPCPQPCDIDCDDGNACSRDSCSPSSGCVHVNDAQLTEEATGFVWDAGAKSTTSWSAAPNATGYTVYAGNRGTLDPLLTTAEDSCAVATATSTTSGNVLTDTPAPGVLYWYVVRPTTSCAEGPAGDATAGPRIQNSFGCNDGNACTVDSCTANGCTHTALGCDDGVACTVDSCDPWTGCVHTPNNAACDDGNTCTDDTCSAMTGCSHANNTATCDDGTSCTTGDHCQNGICIGGGWADHLVISQIQLEGDGASALEDEFVEIYNPTPTSITLAGESLQWKAVGGAYSVHVFGAGASVPAHGWFLLTRAGYNGPVAPDELNADYAMPSPGGNLFLVSDGSSLSGNCPNDSRIIDRVAYGTGSCPEGAPTPQPAANNSVDRKPGGSCGNGQDTGNNAADFSLQSPANPHNRLSTPQP